MANLEPMPISSLPEGSIQDGDKMIIYRDSNGKAYQSDASSMESVAEIKEEVDKLSDDVEQISADLTDLNGKLFNSLDNLWSFGTSLTLRQGAFVWINNTLMGELTGISSTSKGLLTKSSDSMIDIALWATNGSRLIFIRLSDGEVSSVYQYSGTSVSVTSTGNPVVMGEDDA